MKNTLATPLWTLLDQRNQHQKQEQIQNRDKEEILSGIQELNPFTTKGDL